MPGSQIHIVNFHAVARPEGFFGNLAVNQSVGSTPAHSPNLWEW